MTPQIQENNMQRLLEILSSAAIFSESRIICANFMSESVSIALAQIKYV